MQANYSRRMNGKEVSVGGEIYVLYPFPAFTAANLSGELTGLLLPAVGALAPLFRDKKLSLDDDLNNVAPQLCGFKWGQAGKAAQKAALFPEHCPQIHRGVADRGAGRRNFLRTG